jgi:hypothetical protein
MLSSRERVLRTIDGHEVDYTPLSFLLFGALRQQCGSEEEFYRRQLEIGVDTTVNLGGGAYALGPGVTAETTVQAGRPDALIHKVYHTPAGDLTTVVRKTPDWPHGDDVPLMSDHIIPRAVKFLVTEERDLEPLRCLLGEASGEQRAALQSYAATQREFASVHQLATRAGGMRLSDMICWLCGCEQFAIMGLTNPGLLRALVELIAAWQEGQIRGCLELGPDLLIDPQWYATTFLSPSLYEEFLAPAMRRRVELAHAGGARYCTVATANVLPFSDCFRRLGMDVVFGVDPLEGGWDLARAKRELGDRVCLWGGVNGYLTLVDGTPADARRAVADAIAALSPGGRFILGPVDDVRIDAESQSWERVWQNTTAMVEAWWELR